MHSLAYHDQKEHFTLNQAFSDHVETVITKGDLAENGIVYSSLDSPHQTLNQDSRESLHHRITQSDGDQFWAIHA